MNIKYINGHQDDKITYEALSLAVQLNYNAGFTAVYHQVLPQIPYNQSSTTAYPSGKKASAKILQPSSVMALQPTSSLATKITLSTDATPITRFLKSYFLDSLQKLFLAL
jgi:hypothetical protein